jgi:hypothetical protein
MANNFKTYLTALGTTDETTLITAANTSVFIVGSIIISNSHASTTSTISLVVTDTSAAASFNILTTESFAPTISREILSRPMIVENLDVLKAQATDASVFDIIISYIDRDRT